MARIMVIGTSGAGKTTAAARMASLLGVDHVELDSMFHLPDWRERPPDEFRALVDAATAGPDWVVDGNYSVVRALLLQRAETVVWLDYPRWRVMSRVTRRTLRRLITRETMWGVVKEPWSNVFSADPQRSIIAWAWTTHAERRQRYRALVADPTHRDIRFIVVHTPRQFEEVIHQLTAD